MFMSLSALQATKKERSPTMEINLWTTILNFPRWRPSIKFMGLLLSLFLLHLLPMWSLLQPFIGSWGRESTTQFTQSTTKNVASWNFHLTHLDVFFLRNMLLQQAWISYPRASNMQQETYTEWSDKMLQYTAVDGLWWCHLQSLW